MDLFESVFYFKFLTEISERKSECESVEDKYLDQNLKQLSLLKVFQWYRLLLDFEVNSRVRIPQWIFE